MRILLVALAWIGSACWAQEASSWPKILEYAQSRLPHEGILKSSQGFVYVDVDDAFIYKLLPFIQEGGFEAPPYFGRSDLVGAHITVIYPDEVKKYGIKKIRETEEVISFTPKTCQIVHPQKWHDIDEVFLLVVDAPELDLIREKYGLPRREYDFHITIGIKPKMVKSA